jgi:hypothetical protein
MRIVLVLVASLACACVVEEPNGEVEGSVAWSEEEVWSQAEAEAEPDAVWRPSCHHHFECCQDTKLGKKEGRLEKDAVPLLRRSV